MTEQTEAPEAHAIVVTTSGRRLRVVQQFDDLAEALEGNHVLYLTAVHEWIVLDWSRLNPPRLIAIRPDRVDMVYTDMVDEQTGADQ